MNQLEPYFDIDFPYNHSHRHQFDHLGLTHIADRLVFLQDFQVRMNQGAERARDLIQRARRDTGRLPVLCLDGNPCNVFQQAEALQKISDPTEYFLFTADLRPEFSTLPNLGGWPSWLILQQLDDDRHRYRKREYRVSMMSGSMRYHRLLLYRTVRDVIQPRDVVVINRMGDFASSVPGGALTAEEISQWEQELPWANDMRHVDHPDWNSGTSWNLPPNQGNNWHAAFAACVNVTNETGPVNDSTDVCFLTEKTWKPLRSHCLLVNYGAPGARDFLRSQGIGIWDLDTDDHDYRNKIPSIREIFQRDDIWDQYRANQDMTEHNRDLVMSRDFAIKLATQALERLEAWI